MPVKSVKLDVSDKIKVNYNHNKAEINKELSRIHRNAINISKPNKCYLCGKEQTSFSNSHSVPKSCLKTISNNGVVFQSLLQDNLPFIKSKLGIGEAGTFHIICNECENYYFRNYENYSNYSNDVPKGNVLAEIAVKNNLLMIGKRLVEKQLYLYNFKRTGDISHLYQLKVLELDLNEYLNSLNRAKMAVNGKHNNFYYCFYYRKLNYIVPYACQSSIALHIDIEGNIINNLYNYSEDYRVQSMHICVFPHSEGSILLMFIDSKDKRYRSFYKQLNKLSEEDKLAVLNYIAFAYTENVFISNKLDEKIIFNKNLVDICADANMYLFENINDSAIDSVKEDYSFRKRLTIPNLLSSEYAL